MKILSILIAAMISAPLMAGQEAGTITKIQGTVQIFSNPGKTVKGPAPHALYEGEYYSVKDAAVGDSVDQGNVVRTAPGAVAKVVYENGDQVNVGPASAYRVFWEEGKGEGNNTSVSLLYGKFRNVVSKTGPRNNMQIKTANATMGVRGTDFYVAATGNGKAEVTVLRGSVAVTPKAEIAKEGAPAPKPVKAIEVQAGSTAVVKAPVAETKELATTSAGRETAAKKPAEQAIEVRPTYKEELKQVEKMAIVKEEKKTTDAPVAEHIQKLESKAVETTMQDIKTHDPKLFAQLEKSGVKTTEELTAKSVEKVAKAAPQAPRKPSSSDFDDNQDYYQKYFKIVD